MLSKSTPIILIVLILVVTVLLSWQFWQPLKGEESASSTVRNVGLVAGGLIAVVLGTWRSSIAQRRAEAAESDSLDGLFQTAAEMLGHPEASARIGGVVTLLNLGKKHPERYRQTAHDVLLHFAVEQSENHAESPRPTVTLGDLTYHGPQDGALAFLGYHDLEEIEE